MVRVYGKPYGQPGYDCHDPFISTPVIIPYGYRNGCCECGPDGIPLDHVRTHARDAILVGPKDAGTAIRLDDGTGEGFRCPLPLDCLELRVRYKGERCYCLTIRATGITDAGELDIRWPPEWHRMQPGYYEALIVFNPHTPVQAPGGWLLFLKKPPEQMRVRRSRPLEASPMERMDPDGCSLTGPISATYPQDEADCNNEGCGPCQ